MNSYNNPRIFRGLFFIPFPETKLYTAHFYSA